jgi:hypothetical protein
MILGSTILEVGVGVIFVYLLLSLLCSAVSELIESFIKFRARDLETGIGKLLADEGLAKEFFEHPLVKPLGDKPSYIPARTFSLALWNIATASAAQTATAAGGVTRDLATIRTTIAGIQDTKLEGIKKALLTLIDEAGGDINRARANIEQWYDDAMDRVSGWYKRRTHWILIALGLLAAAAFNADTITIVKALWFNDALRSSVVAVAQDYASKTESTPASPAAGTQPTDVTTTPATPPPAGTTLPPTGPGPTPPSGRAETPPAPTPEQQAAAARQKISTITAQFNSLNLPIGWPVEPRKEDKKYQLADTAAREALFEADMKAYETDPRRPPSGSAGLIIKLLGLIITALAISQGAPFWFDVLNKFIVIRSTVKPREKSLPEGSKDKREKS